MSYSEPERSLDRLAGFTREAQSAAPRGGGSRRAAATQTDRVVFLIARASANLADGLDRLTPAGHAARAFLECERALVELRACTRCVVLLDLELAGATELIDALRDRPGVAVVALVDGPPEAASALAQGVDDVAVRPWTPSALQLRAQAAAARVDRSYSPKGATGFDAWATHTDDALALLDEAGRVLVWNLGAVAILGHEPRAMVGRSFFDLLVDPDDPVRDELLVGNAANHPVTLRRFEGHPQEFSLTVTRWQEGGRRRIGLRIEELGSAQVEDELMRLASFPELDPNPVFELRGAGEVSYANPAMRALPEVDEATLIASVREAIANYHEADGVSLTRELPCGDAWFEQHIHFAPAWDSIRVYAQNITERKAAERRLIEARDTLEHRVRERTADLQHEVEIRKLAEDRAREANEAKSAFLATMSHELR
ncbi:MAG: PAS domain-containing protein, partial [Myxococcales bacterium]|nr:PAS domain-containing protein [Myxococcales bacterium]